MSRRLGLFAIAFGSGFAVLTIEIAGARLIAPVFGLSVVPWTAVIGVILAALALGSHLGGRMADAGRVPLSRLLLIAGVTGALPVIGAGVPWVARDVFGFIPGAVVSALILFAPSVLCLGAVVPFLVQADTKSLDAVGRRAGDVSAVATAGSITGSFTTGFMLLPLMPLPVLLGATAAALLLMAFAADRLLGQSGTDGRAAAGVVALPLLGLLASGSPPDTLYSGQSLYSAIAVTERPWADGRLVRELWQNGGSSSAEYVEDGSPAHVYAVESLTLLEEMDQAPARVLVLGGAALTLPAAFADLWPEASIDVIEIDERVTALASEYFVIGERPRPNVHVVHEDARLFLRDVDQPYDLVYLDVFDHLLTVPWTMVTREALEAMAGALTPEGIFMANVLSPQEGLGTAFLSRFRVTLDEVWPDARIFLTDPATDPGATQNMIVVAADAGVLPDLEYRQTSVAADGRVLTDSWAPVEYLQARVFLQGLRWR